MVFNAFEGKPKILRLFCKATIVEDESEQFHKYLELFNEKKSLVRNFFEFNIYAVESSCGDAIPYMEYKGERTSLKEWMVKMDNSDRLEEYKEGHFSPPNLENLK